MVSEEKLTMVMDYIRKFSEENGYTPSVREIGKECGIKSTATVHSYLEKLQTRGYLNKATNKKFDNDFIFKINIFTLTTLYILIQTFIRFQPYIFLY